ncbi:GNAT family N-acetyltransferase [Confluentibacter flavum]|uniref:GNAT family N-acetyltransferase n=1 Tax=Confluentibacter flavum TaxID=1909700 RepID=A0A2N3HJD4_9FLAO|nr:GNAT family N-acetyltransferase [Confluentibacter flavum]PKQ44992.1 GNAT family N-acetyltransferase [Confluentibacter flavum]
MSFTIRKAKKKDMAAVFQLIKELAIYEKEPDAVEITINELENDGFGKAPQFECFVGEIDSKIEGIALFYNRYSTWKGRALHLEDLIVREDKRGMGLGTSLLNEVIKYGYHLGIKRINWEVLDWNEPAISFYEKKGAKVMRDWDVVQLSEQGIKDYISKL